MTSYKFLYFFNVFCWFLSQCHSTCFAWSWRRDSVVVEILGKNLERWLTIHKTFLTEGTSVGFRHIYDNFHLFRVRLISFGCLKVCNTENFLRFTFVLWNLRLLSQPLSRVFLRFWSWSFIAVSMLSPSPTQADHQLSLLSLLRFQTCHSFFSEILQGLNRYRKAFGAVKTDQKVC